MSKTFLFFFLRASLIKEEEEADEEIDQGNSQDEDYGIIEVEHTVESLIEASQNPPQLATRPSSHRTEERSGSSTREASLQCDPISLNGLGSSQATAQADTGRSEQQKV